MWETDTWTCEQWAPAPGASGAGAGKPGLLGALLLNGPAAPVHRALIASGLAPEYAPYAGFDNSTADATFGLGAAGVTEGDVDAVLGAVVWA